jgi:hypothetical protein
MKINCINDARDLVKKLESESKKVLFRGHSNSEWKLVPTIGRDSKVLINEKSELEKFKAIILRVSNNYNDIEYFKEFGSTDFSLLALAQHYSVFPTRFLDWTDNILIALFFACNDYSSLDGCIWMFSVPGNSDSCWRIHERNDDPSTCKQLKIFFVPFFIDEWREKIENKTFGNRRPQVQRSIMTIHPKEGNNYKVLDELIESEMLSQVRIPAQNKESILRILSEEYFINSDTILNGKTDQDIKSEQAWKLILQKNIAQFCKI